MLLHDKDIKNIMYQSNWISRNVCDGRGNISTRKHLWQSGSPDKHRVMESFIGCIQPDHWWDWCVGLSLLSSVRPSICQSTFWFTGRNLTTPSPIDFNINMVVDYDMTLIPFKIGIRVGQWKILPREYSTIQFEEEKKYFYVLLPNGRETNFKHN